MICYMKRAAQIVVLTGALVFSGLLVLNTDLMTKDAEGIAFHQDKKWHVSNLKYYTGRSNGRIVHKWEWQYYVYIDYR